MNENNFKLEHQYQQYLKRVGLSEDTMPAIQKQETKRAFYGACGIMLVLFRDDITAIENEDKTVNTILDMFNQVNAFWQAQK